MHMDSEKLIVPHGRNEPFLQENIDILTPEH